MNSKTQSPHSNYLNFENSFYNQYSRKSTTQEKRIDASNLLALTGVASSPARSEIQSRIAEQRLGYQCTPACRHPWIPRDEKSSFDREREEHARRCQEIKNQIKAQNEVLKKLEVQKENLLTKLNNELNGLDDVEKKNYANAENSLKSFHSHQQGIVKMNEKYLETISQLKQETQTDSEQFQKEIDDIQEDVDKLDEALTQITEELKVVNNYKKNEYQLKVLKIKELEQFLENLKLSNAEEVDRLEHIIKEKKKELTTKFSSQRNAVSHEINDGIFNYIDNNIKDLVQDNARMEIEIQFYQKEIEKLEIDIATLQTKNLEHIKKKRIARAEVAQLNLPVSESTKKAAQNHNSDVIRKVLLPSLNVRKEKCKPEDDVFLDIPLPINLPI